MQRDPNHMPMSILSKLHKWLLPPERDLGWQPYVWLLYLTIYFFSWPFRDVSNEEVVASAIGMAIFLVIYFSGFRRCGLALIAHIVAILILGLVLVNYNLGASVFFVYAASFCSTFKKPVHGIVGIVGICAIIALYSWFNQLPAVFALPAVFFSAMIGLSNIYFVQMTAKNAMLKASQEEVKQLATVAERERIARDLHDLIGHSFSLMSKKAELARKLIDVDTNKAKTEIEEIEVLSRDSLSQVREAVTGYRKRDLTTELASAKALCRASDIRLSLDIEKMILAPQIDQALSYCLREALTNVVKHSKADKVSITLTQHSTGVNLIIEDNGKLLESAAPGNGIKGMQERVMAAGGTLTIDNHDGFQLRFHMPTKETDAND